MLPPEPIEAVREFVERGGGVLLVIGLVLLTMWTLMLERLWYFRFVQPARAKQVLTEWRSREDRTSWYAEQVPPLVGLGGAERTWRDRSRSSRRS